MAKSENFNASINFGAKIDPSIGHAIHRMTSGLLDVETVTEKVMKVQAQWVKDMESGGSTTAEKIGTVTKAMTALEHKQKALQRAMHDAQKEGKDISEMAMDYGRLAHGIDKARKELEGLNREQEREAKSAHRRELLSGDWGKAWRSVKGLKDAPGRIADSMAGAVGKLPSTLIGAMGSTAKWATIGSLGLAGGAVAGGLGMMDKMSEDLGLAKSYGMSYEKFKTGGILASRAGLNAENFGDLTEELSNKIGEMGNEKTINPMLGQLGMTKNMLKGLSKGGQFDKIMQAITARVQSGGMSKQQGESLADQLMGGEANKLVTYILETGKTYEQAMKDAGKLQNTTNEEAEGAAKTARVLSDLWLSGESALEGVVGEIGVGLAPQLQAMEDDALKWIRDNKEAIQKSIGDWVSGGGPKRFVEDAIKFGKALGELGEATISLARKFGLIDEDRKPEEMETIQEARQNALEAEARSRGISTAGLSYQEAISIGRNAEIAWRNAHSQSRMTSYQSPMNFSDDDLGGAIPTIPGATSQDTHTYHINPTFNITMQPGQSSQDVVQDIMGEFNKMVPNFSPAPTFDTY